VTLPPPIPGRLAEVDSGSDAMDHAGTLELLLFLAIVMLLFLAIVEGWK
jgi:hypothetical protein